MAFVANSVLVPPKQCAAAPLARTPAAPLASSAIPPAAAPLQRARRPPPPASLTVVRRGACTAECAASRLLLRTHSAHLRCGASRDTPSAVAMNASTALAASGAASRVQPDEPVQRFLDAAQYRCLNCSGARDSDTGGEGGQNSAGNDSEAQVALQAVRDGTSSGALQCNKCGARIDVAHELREQGYVDLTPERFERERDRSRSASSARDNSGTYASSILSWLPWSPFSAPSSSQSRSSPLRQELFRTPLVAYLYERGWRNNFNRVGFPGIDVEHNMMEQYFQTLRRRSASEDAAPSTQSSPPRRVLDVSCGSGLMTRRLLASGAYDKVVAVDYSDSMLRETIQRASPHLPDAVVRADVERLPFMPRQFGFVHAGAALHCWPHVQDGLREVRRVLPHDGRVFATTILTTSGGVPQSTTAIGVSYLTRLPLRGFNTFDVRQLERLLRGVGFRDVDIEAIDRCAIIRCRAPAKV